MNTKNLLSLMILAMVVLVLASCGGKKSSSAVVEEEGSGDWPAMDHFHVIMAECYHPYKDSANLLPAKQNAAAMAEAAGRWLNTPLPAQVDNEETRERLRLLSEATSAFATTVSTGDDEVVGESLNAIHDIFHELQETWYAHHTEEHEHH